MIINPVTGEVIESKFRSITDLKKDKVLSTEKPQTEVSQANQNYVDLSTQVHSLLGLGTALSIEESDYELDLSKMTVEEALDAFSDPTEVPDWDLVDVPSVMEVLNAHISSLKQPAVEQPETTVTEPSLSPDVVTTPEQLEPTLV